MEVVIIIVSFNIWEFLRSGALGWSDWISLEAVKVHEDFIDRRKDPFKCLQVEERTMIITVLLL